MDIATKAKNDVSDFSRHVELLNALADFADKVDGQTSNSFALLCIHHVGLLNSNWAGLHSTLTREVIPLVSDIKSLRVAV
jgi:hypothetical protein